MDILVSLKYEERTFDGMIFALPIGIGKGENLKKKERCFLLLRLTRHGWYL